MHSMALWPFLTLLATAIAFVPTHFGLRPPVACVLADHSCAAGGGIGGVFELAHFLSGKKVERTLMQSMIYWPTVAVLAVATFTDMRSRRIPNWLVLPFLPAGIAVSVWLHGWQGLGQSLAGFGLGAGIFGLLFCLGGMGMGDVKLCAAIGAWIGPVPAHDRTGHYRPGGRSDGGVLGGLARIPGQPVHWIGGAHLRPEGARTAPPCRDESLQSARTQDALRAGHCHRNADVVLRPLRREIAATRIVHEISPVLRANARSDCGEQSIADGDVSGHRRTRREYPGGGADRARGSTPAWRSRMSSSGPRPECRASCPSIPISTRSPS